MHGNPDTSSSNHYIRQLQLDTLLLTPKPKISLAEASYVAKCCYPAFSHHCKRLSGERDANFRISNRRGQALSLKFINPAEDTTTTEMQIALLKHLAANQVGAGATPRHQACLLPPENSNRFVSTAISNNRTCDWVDYLSESEHSTLRVRAYGFLEGYPGSQLTSSQPAWMALGRQMAELSQRLSDFQHPATHRRLLWNTMHASELHHLIKHIKAPCLTDPIRFFLDRFEKQVAPTLTDLPQQLIHNDFSPSNILVDPAGRTITGILDFGDAVHAPRIAEIAVGASYQMNRHQNPFVVLNSIVHGYESVLQLLPEEHDHIFDLILARLVQRIAITSWRADRFPENRDYIMRSASDAIFLFSTLHKTLYT